MAIIRMSLNAAMLPVQRHSLHAQTDDVFQTCGNVRFAFSLDLSGV